MTPRAGLSRDLRESVTAQAEQLAEQVFVQKRDAGVIRFDLASFETSYRMPASYKISVPRRPRPLVNEYGQPVKSSLFDWVPEEGFNELEREAAYCLDDHAAVRWWHRITARQQNEYYLRGWRDQRIFPDFVAMAGGTGRQAATAGVRNQRPATRRQRRHHLQRAGAENP